MIESAQRNVARFSPAESKSSFRRGKMRMGSEAKGASWEAKRKGRGGIGWDGEGKEWKEEGSKKKGKAVDYRDVVFRDWLIDEEVPLSGDLRDAGSADR